MNLVQYLAINRYYIPAGTIAAYVRDGLVDVVCDQMEISPRLVSAFTALGSTIVAMASFRNAPTEKPWCPVVISPLDDADTERIIPEMTQAGLVVPVPSQLISARMAKHISHVSTDLTRWWIAPSWLRNGEPPQSAIPRGV